MAKFEIAESITGRNEGGYANNPSDTGGETYAGIARNYWPKWDGWKYIDKYKLSYNKSDKKMSLAKWVNSSALVSSEPIHFMVSAFYKQNFWDVNKLDLFYDQQLANTVYDFGVNSGTGRSAKFLQKAYNDVSVNLNKIDVDGKIGEKTIEAINNAIPELIYIRFNTARKDFYNSIAKGSQAQFLKSWLSRLKPYKK